MGMEWNGNIIIIIFFFLCLLPHYHADTCFPIWMKKIQLQSAFLARESREIDGYVMQMDEMR